MKNKTAANPFISFYTKHKISPIHQDISDFKRHLARREKLYRLLALVPSVFKDRTVLEIGPGGGYNALALFFWGADVVFVEPNPKAQEELPQLLKSYKIKKGRWKLFSRKIEEFVTNKKYDIVIAEGFIPGLYKRNEVIAKISGLVSPGGVVVVTCMDEMSFFFELVKRLLAHRLIWKQNAKRFTEKVDLLSRAFLPHLKSLRFASRPIHDWVADNFLNPAIYGEFFSIAECLEEFGDDFMFLGSSPAMFNDYSWYKDFEFDSRKSLLEQFHTKRHVFMLWDMPESFRKKDANKILVEEIHGFRMFSSRIEHDLNDKKAGEITRRLRRIKHLTTSIDARIPKAIDEAISLLLDKDLDEYKIANAKKLVTAFGRGQQYVSLTRRFTNKLRVNQRCL